MKAIETRYKGYRFRSRLEARWAVFFDAMGIKYEYEPEGFVLDDGTHYLPDFRVTTPQGRTIWYEIKPSSTSDGIDKAKKFMSMFSAEDPTQCCILIGDPVEFLSKPNYSVCPRCGQIGAVDFGIENFGDEIAFGCYPCDCETPCGGGHPTELSRWVLFRPHKGVLLIDARDFQWHKNQIDAAAAKARAARFEHGQTPS